MTDVPDRDRTTQGSGLTEILDLMPDAVCVYRGGSFAYVNQATVAALGYGSAEELLRVPVAEIVHPDDRKLAAERTETMKRTGGPAPLQEFRYLRKDGSVIKAEVVSIPVSFEGAPAVIAMARDTSERDLILSKVMRMDRVLTVGTLAGGLGHEITNPLTFVQENIRFALERLAGVEGMEDVVEALEEARYGAGRIALVARDLRAFARSDADGASSAVDIEKIVESAVSLSWNEIRHRAHLVREIAPDLHVRGSEARLGQVFLNLLQNAAHSIPEGFADRNEISVRILEREGRVVVEIEDTGCGIPEEVQERIFDPFYTTKPAGQGTGLGLSICREIVHAYGGEISVSSRPGQGSKFSIELPAAEHPKVAEPPEPPDRAGVRRARILVVDDEPMICNFVVRALGKDHEVVSHTDPRQALETITRCQTFDIILLDLMMPDMTGMDLYAELERRSPDDAAKVVFLTGGAFTPRAREFLESVANRRIDKPFDVRALRSTVDSLMGTRST